MPSHVKKLNHAVDLTDANLLAEKLCISYLNKRLNVSVPQVDQVDCVLVARNDVRELLKLARTYEQGLEVSGVRVNAGVFDVHWLQRFSMSARRPIDQKNTGLIPNCAKETTFSDRADLSYVASRHYLFFTHDQVLVARIVGAEKEPVPAAKGKRKWLVSLHDLVDVGLEGSQLDDFAQIGVVRGETNDINEALILAANYRFRIDKGNAEHVGLSRYLRQCRKVRGFHHVAQFLLSAYKDDIFHVEGTAHVLNFKCLQLLHISAHVNIHPMFCVHA